MAANYLFVAAMFITIPLPPSRLLSKNSVKQRWLVGGGGRLLLHTTTSTSITDTGSSTCISTSASC